LPRIQLSRQLLGHFDPAVAAPVLVDRFKSCRKADRPIVAEALGELGPDAAKWAGPCLVSMLASTNSAELAAAILALGEVLYRPEEVVPKLVPFLTNLNSLVRMEASYTLGTYKPFPGVTMQPLIERLSDSNEVVKANAARALGRMGTNARPAVDILVMVLRNTKGTAPIVPRALEALSSIAQDSPPITRGALNQWAAIKIPADPYFRVMAETATVRFGFHEADLTSDCLNLVKSPKAYIRWEALERLGECGPGSTEVRTALAAGLSDPNGLVRHTARQALDQWNRRHDPAVGQ
jgi:HEAT repeat protein